MRPPNKLPYRDQRGVTLIEVLVSLVILSIALLGIAGLQAATTSYQRGVVARSSLSFHLNDVTGRMRSNLAEVPGYDILATGPGYSYSATWTAQQTAITAPSKLCGAEATAVPCNSAERAAYDVYMWRKQVREAVPQGSVLLSGNLNTGLNVTFMWYDKDKTGKVSGVEQVTSSETCAASYSRAGKDVLAGEAMLIQQVCCPAAASAPAGVRCANFTVLP